MNMERYQPRSTALNAEGDSIHLVSAELEALQDLPRLQTGTNQDHSQGPSPGTILNHLRAPHPPSTRKSQI